MLGMDVLMLMFVVWCKVVGCMYSWGWVEGLVDVFGWLWWLMMMFDDGDGLV